MQKYLKAIRDNICAICVDSSEDGYCTLNEKEMCAVEMFLPQIIDVVHQSDSDNFHEYYALLKEKVCTDCHAQDQEGNCYLREDANCSLDRYFSVIVETIQKVDAKHA